MSREDKVLTALLFASVLSGALRFDGLAISFALMLCTCFITDAIKPPQDKQ